MKKRLLVTFSLLSLLIISACSDSDPSTSVDSSEDNKTLTIAQGADLLSFDAGNNRDTPSAVIIRNMFNRLFKYDNADNMEIVPELVEEYETIDDTTWKFKLKEGVKYHNGDELTAEDVVFTIDRLANDEEVRENVYYGPVIDSVQTVGEYEFEIITYEPSPTLLNLLAKNGADILPKNYIEEEGWDGYEANPIGTGPYKFVEWIKDDRVVLEANPDYFEGENAIEWDEVVVRAIPETSTRVSELLTGGADIITDVPPTEWERVEGENLKTVNASTSRVMTLIVRTEDGYITSDEKVREAIDLAIDKEAIVNSILRGAGTPIRSRVVAESFGANPNLQNTSVYDVDRARELLEDYSEDELELTLQSPQGRYLLDSEVTEMVANMLEEVGITVNLEMMESSNFSNAYATFENKELMFIGLGDPMMDASYSLNHFHSDNSIPLMGYSNDEIDDLFEKAGSNLNLEERETQYHRIQEIIAEERPQILLYSDTSTFGTGGNIEFNPYVNDEVRFNDITTK